MKRMTALVLALMMLLTWTAACAESSGTRIRLKSPRVNLVQNEDNKVHLHDMMIYATVGSAEGIPTLQIRLEYGEEEEQQLESAVQVVGSRLVMSLGGISGTYYIDLNDLYDEPDKGLEAATAFGDALLMLGSDPYTFIANAMPKDEDGIYTLGFPLSIEAARAFYARVMGGGENGEGMESAGILSALNSLLLDPDQPIEMMIKYKRKNWSRFFFLLGDGGVQVYSRTKLTTGPMEFMNPSADEVQHDLLNLDQATKDELSSELEFLEIKIVSFFLHSSLRKLMG